MWTARVITVSDRAFRGEREDGSGPVVREMLESAGYLVDRVEIVPDEQPEIERALIRAADTMICPRQKSGMVMVGKLVHGPLQGGCQEIGHIVMHGALEIRSVSKLPPVKAV